MSHDKISGKKLYFYVEFKNHAPRSK